MILTMDGYQRLGADRPAFDRWVDENGLKGDYVFEITYSDADRVNVTVRHFPQDANGRPYVEAGEVVTATKTVTLSSPVPTFVDEHCETNA